MRAWFVPMRAATRLPVFPEPPVTKIRSIETSVPVFPLYAVSNNDNWIGLHRMKDRIVQHSDHLGRLPECCTNVVPRVRGSGN